MKTSPPPMQASRSATPLSRHSLTLAHLCAYAAKIPGIRKLMRQGFNCLALLSLSLALPSCNGQAKRESPENRQVTAGQPKLIQNHFIPDVPKEYFFVQCGLQDMRGNMWFGTAGNGIYVYDGSSFVNFTHQSFIGFSLKDDLNHNDVLCCTEDNAGNIWFGTRRGLIRYKPTREKAEGKDFALFLIPENTISNSSGERLPYTPQPNDNFVWSILQDKSGTLWFGTSKGIYTHNPSADNDDAGPLFASFIDRDSLINDRHLHLKDISTMLQDKNGNIWLASAWTKGEGIIRYDGKSLERFAPDSIFSFRSIVEKQNGDLLFLSPYHGVYSYNGQTFSCLNEKMGLQNDTLVSMLEDKNGNLWLGHGGGNMQDGGDGGLLQFDGTSLREFTTQEGLSHNHVFCMVTDIEGNIWFGTRNTGLCRYDGITFTDFSE